MNNYAEKTVLSNRVPISSYASQRLYIQAKRCTSIWHATEENNNNNNNNNTGLKSKIVQRNYFFFAAVDNIHHLNKGGIIMFVNYFNTSVTLSLIEIYYFLATYYNYLLFIANLILRKHNSGNKKLRHHLKARLSLGKKSWKMLSFLLFCFEPF